MDSDAKNPMDSKEIMEHNTIPAHPDYGSSYNTSELRSDYYSTPGCVGSEPGGCSESDLLASVLSVTTLSVPVWEAVFTGVVLSLIGLITLVGNTFVILSVFTYKPLRITPNFFIASLAMTDVMLALTVFPIAVPYCVIGRWIFGVTMCRIWMSLNVLCCAASILHLCAIALDRYWAIKNPIAYANERTLRRVLVVIGGIWVVSMALSSIFILNGIETFERLSELTSCSPWVYGNDVASVFIAIFFSILLVLIFMYAMIFVKMRRRLRDGHRNPVLCAAKRTPIYPVNDVTSTQSRNEVREPIEAGRRDGSQSTIREAARDEGERANSESGRNDLGAKPASYWSDNDLVRVERGGKEQVLAPKKLTRGGEGSSWREDSLDGSSGENRVNEVVVQTDEGKFNGCLAPQGATAVTGEETAKQGSSPATMSAGTLNPVRQLLEQKQRISLSKERRLAKTLMIIMGAFVLCWLPFFITYLLKPICSSCHPTLKFINFISWMAWINSTLNPFIFTMFNLDFRRAFKKLLHIKPRHTS